MTMRAEQKIGTSRKCGSFVFKPISHMSASKECLAPGGRHEAFFAHAHVLWMGGGVGEYGERVGAKATGLR